MNGLCESCHAPPGAPARGCERHFGKCAVCGLRRGDRVATSVLYNGRKTLMHGTVKERPASLITFADRCDDYVVWDSPFDIFFSFLPIGDSRMKLSLDHSFRGELVDAKRCAFCGADESKKDELCPVQEGR